MGILDRFRQKTAPQEPSDFMRAVFARFDGFQNRRECFAIRGPEISGEWDDYITSPLPDPRLEREWKKIEQGSPIPLPADYRELFQVFGGGWIEDHRENGLALGYISFWTWEDIQFFNDMSLEEFWAECPRMLPFGHEAGSRFYVYGEGPEGLGVYYCSFGCGSYWHFLHKLADSFTALFTDPEAWRHVEEVW